MPLLLPSIPNAGAIKTKTKNRNLLLKNHSKDTKYMSCCSYSCNCRGFLCVLSGGLVLLFPSSSAPLTQLPLLFSWCCFFWFCIYSDLPGPVCPLHRDFLSLSPSSSHFSSLHPYTNILPVTPPSLSLLLPPSSSKTYAARLPWAFTGFSPFFLGPVLLFFCPIKVCLVSMAFLIISKMVISFPSSPRTIFRPPFSIISSSPSAHSSLFSIMSSPLGRLRLTLRPR